MAELKLKAPWYRRAIVGIEVGPTGAQFGIDSEDMDFARRFSGEEIVARCVEASAEYLVIWAKDNEFAYYSSKVVPKVPGLGERDVLREAVSAAKAHDLPVIAYCELQYPAYLLGKHPEYRMLDINGDEIPGRVCFNSGYLDHVKQIAAEMIDYGIDGFHFDMMDQGFGPPYGCWCPRCQALFREEYGGAMPAVIGWDGEWERVLEFRYNTSARFEEALTAFVRRKGPKLSVDFNYHGAPPCSWEVGQRPVQHAHIGDFVTGECGIWAFGALHTSLAALFLASTKPDGVYQVVMQRGARTYHDMTTRPLADLRWEALTLLSHGAQVTIVDKTPYDGQLDPVAYERMGAVFAEAKRKRAHFGHKPFQEVGLYYSCRSRDWYGKDEPDRYQRAFVGAHRALIYSHIPTGVILDENVTAERLKAFPIIYLPSVAVLTEAEIDLLRDYVSAGGNLLATGVTGCYGRRGEKLNACALSDLIGGRLIESTPYLDNHIALPTSDVAEDDIPQPIPTDIPADWPFLVYGPSAIFEPTTAKTYGSLYRPHRTLRQRKGEGHYPLPMSADVPVGPAILVNTCGRGKAVYLPCAPDVAVAGEYRTAEPRLLIRNLVRFLNPTPDVEVRAPCHVESVITEDEVDRLLRIHLIGYLSPPASTGPGRPHSNWIIPSLIEDKPLYRAEIILRRPFEDVQSLHPETGISRTPDGIQVLVNDIHETLIIT